MSSSPGATPAATSAPLAAPGGGAAWKAEAYASENSGQFVTALEALALAGAHLHSGGRLADVGCGSGEIAEAMADRHFEVVANDGSPSMVEATRRRCAGKSVAVEFQDAHLLELPVAGFDVVHSSWMLHWLGDPGHALRTMARAVRPGGTFVLQWSFGQPAAEGFPMRDVLDEVVARPAWRERLAAVPLAMFQHPVELVRQILEDEGLEIRVEQRDVEVPGPRDQESLRRVTRTTAFTTQADALGEDADAFIDEALRALFEAGRTNVHNTRIIAVRAEEDEDAGPPALVRPFPQAVGLLEVASTEQVSPLTRRLVFRGPALADLVIEQPGEIITLIWPAEGRALRARVLDDVHVGRGGQRPARVPCPGAAVR
ncbi:methyltransferase domain-containing protein, partial [Kitasatospora sp. NPDC001574]